MTQSISALRAVHTKQPPLAGRTAVISGGTSGNGRAIAALLATEGADVLLFGRHQPEVDATVAALSEAAGRVFGTVADQTDPAAVRDVFTLADSRFGRVDILINNAGIYAGEIGREDEETWRYHLHTDLDGYIDCTRHAIARMRSQGRGHIVNIGSMSAVRPHAGHSLYVAAKAAIHGYSRALGRELERDGIKVSLIEPGLVGTPIFSAAPDPERADPHTQHARQEEGSMLKPEDIAVAVYYCLTQPERCTIGLVQVEPSQHVSRADF